MIVAVVACLVAAPAALGFQASYGALSPSLAGMTEGEGEGEREREPARESESEIVFGHASCESVSDAESALIDEDGGLGVNTQKFDAQMMSSTFVG